MAFLLGRNQLTDTFIEKHLLPYLNIPQASYQVLETGCDSYAIDFGSIIVRLPRDDESLECLRMEALICERIRCPELQTPQTKLVLAGEYPFSWHQKIPGNHLLTENYLQLTDTQKDQIAYQIAKFFIVMHGFAVCEMQELGVSVLGNYVSADDMLRLAAEVVPIEFEEHFSIFIEQYLKLSRCSGDLVFGYFDLHSWNAAFDLENGLLVGVYDFADCGIGDLHQEFHPINTISSDLVVRVVAKYEAFTDRRINISKVNFFTVLAQYSDLYELASGKTNLMGKGREDCLAQLRRWVAEIPVFVS